MVLNFAGRSQTYDRIIPAGWNWLDFTQEIM
jgi:hypothetical protein